MDRDYENDLEDTCPHTKVVSGPCDPDGFTTKKYISYHYDY